MFDKLLLFGTNNAGDNYKIVDLNNPKVDITCTEYWGLSDTTPLVDARYVNGGKDIMYVSKCDTSYSSKYELNYYKNVDSKMETLEN